MQSENVNEIIQFAIGKEQEAIDFYTNLAGRVKLEAVAQELLKLADMERGHKHRLETLDVEAFIAVPAERPRDLKIANYMEKAVVTPDMDWQDILNVAMHRELAAANLYKDLAESTGDPKIKQLFEGLASEEQKHKLYLETLWDQEVMKEN
jgi:rubrerythrin